MLKHNFCPSPWFHVRIDNQGDFRSCRWRSNNDHDIGNIRDRSVQQYFQQDLSPLRAELLHGQRPAMCADCHQMEQHGKVSGRQRQLLKVGVHREFAKSLRSSSIWPSLVYSAENNGDSQLMPQDWQIDLGNYCNSACVFCEPRYSSRLAAEFKNLRLIQDLPAPNWADDAALVEKFCDDLVAAPNLVYLHFIGGETLITPAFARILQRMVDAGRTDLDLGFTTNLTVWPTDVVALLEKFTRLHVGLSVECLTDLNDYLRWPSKLCKVQDILQRWVTMARQHGWLLQLRPTPNCFSIQHLTTIYDYAYLNDVTVESCNFMSKPRFMKINVLPDDLKQMARNALCLWLDQHAEHSNQPQIVNTRDQNTVHRQIYQDAESYLRYLDSESSDPDGAPELAKFLRVLESSRGNRILSYLPQYEQFLRSAGY